MAILDALNSTSPIVLENDLYIFNLQEDTRKSIFQLQEEGKMNFLGYLDLLKEKYGKDDLIYLYNRNSVSEEEFINIIISLGKIEKSNSNFISFKGLSEIVKWPSMLFKIDFILEKYDNLDILKYLSFIGDYYSLEEKINIILNENNKNSYIIKNIGLFYDKIIEISKNSKNKENTLIIKLLPLNKDVIDFFGIEYFAGMKTENIEIISNSTINEIKEIETKIIEELGKENHEIKNKGYITVKRKKIIKKDESGKELKLLIIKKLLNNQRKFYSPSVSVELSQKDNKKPFIPININKDYQLSNDLKEKFEKWYTDFKIGNYNSKDISTKRDGFGNRYFLSKTITPEGTDINNYLNSFSHFLINMINEANSINDIEKIPKIISNLNKKYKRISEKDFKKNIEIVMFHYKNRIKTF